MIANKYDHRVVEKKWPRIDLASRRNLPASRSRGAIKRGEQVGFDHRTVEKNWQSIWSKEGLYSPDMANLKKKFYNLWMFPYPSAEGLHAGHAFASTGSDVIGRFKRMNGYNVFQPIGYDSFGIHSENFALKINDHPGEMIKRTTKHYKDQLRSLGHAYDWSKTVTTSDQSYYKWTQWLFVQMFKAGLAYKKKAEVNWCPSCKTVLADEQVVTPNQAGKEPKDAKGSVLEAKEDMQVCERCGTLVERKLLEQWFFKITDYADKLLDGLDGIRWPGKIKTAQRNWIGRSEGAEINFLIHNSKFTIRVFTTRPDTLYGATFLVVSPKYAKENLLKYIPNDKQNAVSNYIITALSNSLLEKAGTEIKKKTGIDIGLKAINPANNKELPIYVSDYVLDEYGTGAIMGVPAHDERDFDFATKYNLPVVNVVQVDPKGLEKKETGSEKENNDGILVNSGSWNGLKYPEDFGKILSSISENGWVVRRSQYHLRDWLISRQRYWGPPIPMIYCETCAKDGKSWFTDSNKGGKSSTSKGDTLQVWDSSGWYPVSETDLPVTLPDISDFKPEGDGRGPLAKHPEFYKTKCPGCGGDAIRETDVSDTFLDSAWYFLRYPSVQNEKSKMENFPWDREITRNWLPVDLYFGGAEHAVLHLMYARFVWKMLVDAGFIDKKVGYEPFPWFFAHGLMIKDGAKMSKSRGNVVNPDEYVEKYGADTLRLYLMFMGPMDGYPDFRDTGIEAMRKYVEKIWQLFMLSQSETKNHSEEANTENRSTNDNILITKMHQTIKKVTEDIEEFKYNTAIAAIMEYTNALRASITNNQILNTKYLKTLALLLAPFTPHLAEEAWMLLNPETDQRVHTQPWPKFDPKLVIESRVTIPIQVNGKLRGTVSIERGKENDKEYISNLAKSDTKISKWFEGKDIKKEIYVLGKLLNYVV